MNLQILFEVSLLVATIVAVLLLFMSSIYDLRSNARNRRIRLPGRAQLRSTILVYARNNSQTITQCLQSIAVNQRGVYDIVVVDMMSADQTRQLVRAYQATHPEVGLYLYAKRTPGDRHVILRQAYQHSRRGELVFVIDADGYVDGGLMQSVAVLSANQAMPGLQFQTTELISSLLGSVVGYFMRRSQSMYRRALVLVYQPRIPFGRSGCVYRTQGGVLPQSAICRYETTSKIVRTARTGLPTTVISAGIASRLQIGVSLAMLGTLTVFMWVVYVAASLQTSGPLLAVWLVVAIWLSVLALSDERTHLGRRLYYFLCTPIFSLIIYIYLLYLCADLVARSIMRQSQLTGVCAVLVTTSVPIEPVA